MASTIAKSKNDRKVFLKWTGILKITRLENSERRNSVWNLKKYCLKSDKSITQGWEIKRFNATESKNDSV